MPDKIPNRCPARDAGHEAADLPKIRIEVCNLETQDDVPKDHSPFVMRKRIGELVFAACKHCGLVFAEVKTDA